MRGRAVHEQGLIRIRLLGRFQVWRADGSEVRPAEWRTGKTTDLLRLLALGNGHPLRPDRLVAWLWPDVPTDRARNSLRTATSRIRQTMGSPCIVRELGGIVLRGAWVDAVEFNQLVRSAHEAAAQGQHQRVLELCRAAEGLHQDEFHAYDDDSEWAAAERDELRRARRQMLGDAAEAALELDLFSEAADLASIAVRIDPSSEAAHRTLMRAYAAMGETARALQVFEALRERLAAELGADPSPQTRELHLNLLRDRGR